MNSLVKVTRFFMIAIGIWKISLTKNVFLQKCYAAYSLAVPVYMNLFTISLLIRLVQLTTLDVPPGRLFGSLTIAIVISMMNASVLILLKNGIPFVFSEVINEEIKILNSKDFEIKRAYLSQIKYYKGVAICVIGSSCSSAISFTSLNLYKKITDTFMENECFMYEAWFPFDTVKHSNLVMFLNMLMVLIGTCCNVASRVTPQALIIFANAQLEILQIRIRKLFSNEDDEEKDIQRKVKDIVRQHQHLIKFVTSLNNSIKNIIFMEYVLNSINVAAAALQIITVKTASEIIFALVFLILVVLQIFTLAWSANEINVQSTKIANAVYDSNWTDQSEAIKKMMYVILMRAQKPLQLTIGPFGPINIESALLTMKGAYSFISVMMQSYT
uniref:Odorant receptor n=1 Tax=Eucryptorrhynchus brandti TaxID=436910 RepID=A0A8F4RQ74_EUCBR|nr:odorant receptor 45 [Eucryptorrhynchus brandti]